MKPLKTDIHFNYMRYLSSYLTEDSPFMLQRKVT